MGRFVLARLACISVPLLPLQLLLRIHPEWQKYPTSVVNEDKPLGTILMVNRQAHKAGIQPGMYYSSALSLSPHLRAATVSKDIIENGIHTLFLHLTRFSPEVEISTSVPSTYMSGTSEPGIFWLDAEGLLKIFTSLPTWIKSIKTDLGSHGFFVRGSVGFTRFGVYAAVKSPKGLTFFSSYSDERKFALRAPLSVLPLDPDVAVMMKNLGITDIQSFLSLPKGGVKLRFGERTESLYEFASAEVTIPLQSSPQEEEIIVHKIFQYELSESSQLVQVFKELLEALILGAEKKNLLIRELNIVFTKADKTKRRESIKPAQPTLKQDILFQLVRLRLESLHYDSPIIAVTFSADKVKAYSSQPSLFHSHTNRDLSAGARAFALIRAELGNHAIQKAKLQDEYPPEKQFIWEDISRPVFPQAKPVSPHTFGKKKLIRRIFPDPVSFDYGNKSIKHRGGPYGLSGNWWSQSIAREYYYYETKKGRILWIYRDRDENGVKIQGYIS